MSTSSRKVAVVTGGRTGIGQACVKGLVDDGYNVAVVSRKVTKGDGDGAQVQAFPCDVADIGQVKDTVGKITTLWGPVHALVNAAGFIGSTPIARLDQKAATSLLGANLNGTINFCAECLEPLKAAKGAAIVNFSSSFAKRAPAGNSIYAAAKGGVESFSRALAREIAPFSIRVNVVVPAIVRSELLLATGMTREHYEEHLAARVKDYPLGRIGEPDDVANLVRFFVSDRAAWLTGLIVPVDGGRSLT